MQRIFPLVPVGDDTNEGEVKGYPFEMALPQGVDVGGVVLSDQIMSLDYRAGNAVFIYRAPIDVVKRVQKNMLALISGS